MREKLTQRLFLEITCRVFSKVFYFCDAATPSDGHNGAPFNFKTEKFIHFYYKMQVFILCMQVKIKNTSSSCYLALQLSIVK